MGLTHLLLPTCKETGAHGVYEIGRVWVRPPRRWELGHWLESVGDGVSANNRQLLEDSMLKVRMATAERLFACADILGFVFSDHHQITDPEAEEPRDHAERAVRYIRAHLREPLCLDHIARIVGLSHEHLCRVFRKRTGTTVGRFIATSRVERAKELLAESRSSITDIAFEAGFQSIWQFNHVFRRQAGSSPRQFRARAWAEDPPCQVKGV
jgi:AraC-like DNA-binding protein